MRDLQQLALVDGQFGVIEEYAVQRREFERQIGERNICLLKRSIFVSRLKAARAGTGINQQLQYMRQLISQPLRMNDPVIALVERGQTARGVNSQRDDQNCGN